MLRFELVQKSGGHPPPQHSRIIHNQLHYLHIQCTVIGGKGHVQVFFASPGSSVLSVQKISCHWEKSVAFTDHKVQEKKCSEQTAVADWDMRAATVCWCPSAEASHASSAQPLSCSMPGLGVRSLHELLTFMLCCRNLQRTGRADSWGQ